MKLTLVRHETSDHGTFGTIEVGPHRFYTGELPWRDNDKDLSCLPVGVYTCIRTMSARFKRQLYLLSPTGKRIGIRIHPANLVGDTKLGLKSQLHGCIALGERLGFIDRQKAILVSQSAVRKFEALLKGQPFTLEIIDAA